MFVAVKSDGHRAKSDMDTEHNGERWVNTGEFLDDDGLRNIVDR